MARQPKNMSKAEVLDAYRAGRRDFHEINLDNADFSKTRLLGISFFGSSLRNSNFEDAGLTFVQFKAADMRGARLARAAINASDLIGAKFIGADFQDADLTGASLAYADLTDADMRKANLGSAGFEQSILVRTKFDGASLYHTNLSDVDVGSLCNAKRIRHGAPSVIDARTVVKSYHHGKFRQFMLDCGVPPIFVDYMIDCARAIDGSLLRSLMQSTFISYGGPDEAFAQKLYDALKSNGVVTFFFPKSATIGERIDNEVFRRLQEHDRVILICSRNSLDRPGVLHEIQETFDREAKDGGATYLLPITLDDYVFAEWRARHLELAERVGRRVVGDFRGAARSKKKFDEALGRLLDALKIRRPLLLSASVFGLLTCLASLSHHFPARKPRQPRLACP